MKKIPPALKRSQGQNSYNHLLIKILSREVARRGRVVKPFIIKLLRKIKLLLIMVVK